VHSNGEVTLKIEMDISSQTGTASIGGITQPIIGQKKITNEVRLKEGEVNLLGGMMENQDTKTLTGIPGLAQIPILKYLFGQTATDHSETETVFVMIPHVVRSRDVTAMNDRAIDVGTASTISLHHRSQPPPAAEAAAPAAASPANNPTPEGAPAQAPPQAAPGAAPASFAFDPPNIVQKAGATFTVNIVLNGALNAYSVPLQVSYDPKVLQVVNVSNGTFLSQDGQAVALVHRDDDTTGALQITATRPPGATGVSGQGTVVTLTFMAKAPGQSLLTILRGGARDPGMQALPVAGAAATVQIQ
jgi:general secretion pathway protein D